MDIKELFNSHKDRIITGLGLILGVVVILAINNFYLMWLVLGIVYIIGIYEANNLFSIDDKNLLFIGAVVWGSLIFVKHLELVAFLPVLVMASYYAYKYQDMKNIFPFLYPTISMILFLALYKDFGVFAIVWLIVVVAFTDTLAYFSGKYFGKTKFSPTSPNKTLEGVAGGVLAGTIFGSIAGLYFNGFLFALVISFFVSVFSVFGDLFESYLKRKSNLKDSGNILPGHGGILDRLDGYLFGVVILYIALKMV